MENTQENSTASGSNEGKMKPYIIQRDGNGNEVRHINFNHPEMCKREGIIRLIPLKTTNRHLSNNSFRRIYDKEHQMSLGIPSHIDPKSKEWVYQKITLVGEETLDLRIDADAKRWAVIKRSHILQGSPNLQGVPVYKVIDTEREAEMKLAKRNIKRKAERIAEDLTGIMLEDMAIACGIPIAGNSPTTLSVAVIEFAERNPKEFMDIWDSDLRTENFILKRAIEMDVVEIDPHHGVMYGGQSMGSNEPNAVLYLKENPHIATAIATLTKRKDEDGQKAMDASKKPIYEDSRDSEIEILKAELARQKELNNTLKTQNIEGELAKDVKGKVLDNEHKLLLEDAKTLGIKGANLMSKETLQTKVDEERNKKEANV